MACKLRCPKCKLMLKEEGDEGKQSQGTYRVFDATSPFNIDAGKPDRVLRCSECGGYFEPRETWDEEFKETK